MIVIYVYDNYIYYDKLLKVMTYICEMHLCCHSLIMHRTYK